MIDIIVDKMKRIQEFDPTLDFMSIIEQSLDIIDVGYEVAGDEDLARCLDAYLEYLKDNRSTDTLKAEVKDLQHKLEMALSLSDQNCDNAARLHKENEELKREISRLNKQ